jgi:hypothetical protein
MTTDVNEKASLRQEFERQLLNVIFSFFRHLSKSLCLAVNVVHSRAAAKIFIALQNETE